MTSRRAHRLSLFGDRDVLRAGVVAASACVLSAGLVYCGYFVHVLRTARRAPTRPRQARTLLLFGKHAPRGRIDNDFEARLDRAVSLWREAPPAHVLLLGGGPAEGPSEAEIARRELHARGLDRTVPLHLESASRDTLQNLRNARRDLLRVAAELPRVALLSNRYHLARCALFARQLGFEWELCAAEPRLQLTPRTLLRLAGEAAYVCWADLGTRWARFTRNHRMLARVT